ncbi:hypothetical protein GGD63_001636 [Bradyrhizobium sp. cir1]|nr:hypothetical protein [Bradyrhizobium sp. cir1]
MNVRDEHTRSLWMDVSVADAPALSRTVGTDVADWPTHVQAAE